MNKVEVLRADSNWELENKIWDFAKTNNILSVSFYEDDKSSLVRKHAMVIYQ